MRLEGRIVQWEDAKGYGFIAPDAGGAKLFVHAKAFGLRPRRPFVGERVSFERGADAQGKARALNVRSLEPKPAPAGPAARASSSSGPRDRAARSAKFASARAQGRQTPRAAGASHPSVSGGSLWLIPAFAGLVLLTHLAWPLPRGLWGAYMAMSLATFIVYALDKRAARLGQWRVKEITLHGLALLCGWPGALLAQNLLRHKSAKVPFRRVFWLSVTLNIVGFVLLFTPVLTPLLLSWGIGGHGAGAVGV